MERVEKSGGEPEDVEDAKNAADALNTKTEEVSREVEMSATDLFEQAQAMETEQKASEPIAEVEKPKDEATTEQKEESVLGITEKSVEARRLQGELDEARKAVALMEKNDPKYAEVLKGYQEKKEVMQNFAYEAKKATLLKKGLSEADTETELSKYAREVLAPNFAVAEAAKIQSERADETMLEKVKDSKVSQMIYGAVDKYRKMSWKQKLALSAGLFGGALVAGTAGGAIGAVIGGGVGIAKLTQRILGGAGTAVGLEATMQRSQQKWMGKEGWGKNRKEYVANQIKILREVVKNGEVSAESLEKAGWMKNVEEALEERKDLEDKFEKRRTILAGIMGGLVGSGAVTQAFKQYWEWSGAKNLIFGTPKEIPGVEKVKEVASAAKETAKEQAKGVVAPLQEKIIPVVIGARGPEGALIDNFKAHPDVAKAFGWDGKSNLSEWAGAKAGELWNADAKEALKNPQILAQMDKLGFSKDAEGYAKMAHRIGKGFIQIDPADKNIKFTDMEYLKNTNKDFEDFLDRIGKKIAGPSSGIKEVPSAGASEVALGTEASAPLQGAQKILHELVNQQTLSEVESKMTPHLEEIIKGLKENGMSEEKIKERMEFIAKAAAERAGVDLSTLGKDVINVDALQQMMESPEGKIGGLVQKLVESKVFTEKEFNSAIEKIGGMNKFMDANFKDLFDKDPLFKKFEQGAVRAFGASDPNFWRRPIRGIMEQIWYKRIFDGTAEELMGKTK